MLTKFKREEPSCQIYGFGLTGTDPSKPCLQPHACWQSSAPSVGPTESEGRKGWWFPTCPALLLEPALSQCLPSLPAPKSGFVLHRGWGLHLLISEAMVFFNEIHVSLIGITVDCDKRTSQYEPLFSSTCPLALQGWKSNLAVPEQSDHSHPFK